MPRFTYPTYSAHAEILRDFRRAVATSAPCRPADTPAARQAAYRRACKAAARQSHGNAAPGLVAGVANRW